jgi:hypothetical protein
VADQNDLFLESQIDGAIILLKEHGYKVFKTAEEVRDEAIKAGYKVSEPDVVNSKIVNMTDLRKYFFKRLWAKHPEWRKYYVQGNYESELRMIRLFVESREKTGLNRFNAIQECVRIIDTIFDHEAEFKFKDPIDIRVLGQGKVGWVTEKASLILAREHHEREEAQFQKLVNEREQDSSMDLAKRASELDAMLAKMGENNG